MNDPTTDRAAQVLRIQSRLESQRSVFNQHWQEIAERVWPDRADFITKRPEGDKRTDKIFDSTATLALSRFGAAVDSLISPRGARWHGLRVPGRNSPEVNRYLEDVRNILFEVRYSPKANFSSQAFESYMSIGAFGTGVILCEDLPGIAIRYKSVHLAEIYFMENAAGMIDYAHRKFNLTAKQAVEKFGRAKLPEKITQALETAPNDKFEFLHCVRPQQTPVGHPFESIYVCMEGKCEVEYGGYWSFPYCVGRYITTPNETYGRSPAMLVLPDIKMVNEMSKTALRAGQLAVQPPLMLQEDGALSAFNLSPGALNYGGIDDQGRQLVQTLQLGANLQDADVMMEQRRRVINDAFLVTLFQILLDKPYMTATEALLRAQEKGQLLAPTVGRIQSEILGPLIERELDILGRAGVLPPPPDELMDMVMSNGGVPFSTEYQSPLNKMMKADDAVGIMRTIEALTPLAQVFPSVMDSFNQDELVRTLAEANGAPARVFRTPEEMAEVKAQKAQQEQMAALLQAAPVASGVAKDMAQVQSMSQSAPVPAGL